MARMLPSAIRIQGSIYDLTIVNSKKYGRHARARRGSITPVTINDELEKSKDQLLECNKPAKMIFDALRVEHKDGDLWQRLLSLFRKQLKEDNGFSLSGFERFECSTSYSLQKLVLNEYTITAKPYNNKMRITLKMHNHPTWKKRNYVTGYRPEVIMLFPDFETGVCTKASAHIPVVHFKDDLKPLRFDLPMPAGQKQWLLLLGITACEKNKIITASTHKGMAVVKVSE